MDLYAGLFLIAIAVAFLLVRFFQSRYSPSTLYRKDARTRRDTPEKPMEPPQRRSAFATGTIQKPWGW